MSWYLTDFCDKVCRKMYELNGKPIEVKTKKKSDKFDDFIERQKAARAKGLKYSYGDYQKERCSSIDIPKPKTDPEKAQCRDCLFFREDKYGHHRCEQKPYTRNGKKRFYPQKYQKACKTYFEPKQ